MTTLELLITNKYLYLIASIILLVCLFIFIYERLKTRAQRVINLTYQLTFELLNGDRLPFHPLSFAAHEHLLTALKGRIKRIALMKDSDVIRECTPEDYLLLKDEVKRLARLL